MAVYKSGYAALQVLVRPEIPFYHPITGVETHRVRRLTADFGYHGGEFTAPNPLTGELEQHAIIHGHFFDTEVAAEREEWSDDERASVETALDKLCREQPYLIAKIDLTPAAAPAPWPTYDTTAEKQIAKLAISLGLVPETVLYERENENRDLIVAELTDWLVDNPVEEVYEEPAPAKIEPGMITLQ